MDLNSFRKYKLDISNTQIDGVRSGAAYTPKPSVSGRPIVRPIKPEPSVEKESDIVALAVDKVFGLMQDQKPYSISKESTVNYEVASVGSTNKSNINKRETLKKRVKDYKYWREARFFFSGASLALGIACMMYFGFYHQPISKAETGSTTQGIVNSDGTVTHTTETGESVNVSPGVDVRNIDHRPPKPIEPDMPARLLIPKIKVNAKIRSLGLTKDGSLAVPNYINQIGWYDMSSRPGSPGTIVLDGHYDVSNNETVFTKNIDTLIKGDEVQIVRGDGQIHSYVIESKELYDKNSVPMDKVIGGDGKERVHIITCFGSWVSREDTYSKRMVFYAVKK